ncbi:MAG TPA: glycosyltransferase family 39 protein [bacterium]|nr:glycosyltransferase family 39 protein [bacterium]
MPRLPRPVLVGLLALLALRLVIAAALPLGDDEAYYWDWSRHLAPGYVDHPPAIALLIWAARHLTANPGLAVHGVAAVLSFVTSLAVYALARDVLGRPEAAAWAVVVFNVVPVFAGGAVLAAPDAPLGLCWVLALLWAWRAVHRPGRAVWAAAGLWTGLALQSKYTAVFLPLSIGAWLALHPTHRRWWRHWEPYGALALAVAVFAPVVWWNAAHHWISFAIDVGRPGWSGRGNFPTFVGLELVYLGPLMLPALLWALAVAARRGLAGDDAWLFLAAAGIPVIVTMFAVSVFGEAKGHWAAPGYVTATIALAGLATERPWRVRRAAWRGTAVAVLVSTLLITALIYAIPAIGPALLPPHLDPTVDYVGWPAASREIVAAGARGARGPYFITSDRYQVMAQFDLYTNDRYTTTTITGEDQYGVWAAWPALRGQDGLFVTDGRYAIQVDLREGCRALEPAPPVPVSRGGTVVRTLGLVWCRGFLGHPIPPLHLRTR